MSSGRVTGRDGILIRQRNLPDLFIGIAMALQSNFGRHVDRGLR